MDRLRIPAVLPYHCTTNEKRYTVYMNYLILRSPVSMALFLNISIPILIKFLNPSEFGDQTYSDD